MTGEYEVVIAGGGPAGAQCARDLAARDYDVLVLETEPEEDFPARSNKSTGGTFPSMMASFNVPDDVVMNFTDSVVLESPSNFYEHDQTGAVLDFKAFKEFLVKDGRDDGAEYRFNSRVTGPVMEGDSIVGVKYTGPGGEQETVRGDIVVDATGPSAPLAKELGVSTLRRERQAMGLEYELEGIHVDHEGYADLSDAMMLRLDHDIAPGGYSWIFHTGADTAKVGVCFIQNDRHKEHAKEDFRIDDYIDYWMENDPRFAEASRIEGVHHRGSAHIQPPGKLSTDNFMAIGDTVPTVDPMWGEGIHAGMQSARAAAITADGVLTPAARDTSAAEMETYDKLWHTQVAPRIRQRLLMTELMYYAPNDRYDRFLSDLDSLDMDTLRRANKGKKRAMLSLFHMRDIPMLTGFLREQLGVKFTQWRRGTLRP